MDSSLVLPTLLEQRSIDSPDRIFLTDAVTGETRTHAEFVAAINLWAGALNATGVQSGDAVLVMMPTSNAAMAAWIGIARLRAMEVPVNSQYHGQMLSYIMSDSTASLMIAHSDYLDQILEVLPDVPAITTVVVVGNDADLPSRDGVSIVGSGDFLARSIDISTEPRPVGHDIAAIVYTSGTTGPSKGVLMPWAQLYETALWMGPKDELTSDDVAYLPYPFYHITIKAPVYLMALVGGSVVAKEKISISNYWDEIERHGVTYTILLAVMINMLSNDEPKPTDADNSLRLVGVVPRPANIGDFERRFGVQSGTIFNMTETSVPFCDHSASPQDPPS